MDVPLGSGALEFGVLLAEGAFSEYSSRICHQPLALPQQMLLRRLSRLEIPQRVLSSSAATTAMGLCSRATPSA